MAQSDIAENLRNTSEAERMTQEIWCTDVMTGGSDRRMQLYYQLIQSLKKADSVDIIVSFLMESGVKMLLDELDNALKRGAKIRILTGNYLGITQPSALYLLKKNSVPESICVSIMRRIDLFIRSHIFFIMEDIAISILVHRIFPEVH